jgi:hypothetical protein
MTLRPSRIRRAVMVQRRVRVAANESPDKQDRPALSRQWHAVLQANDQTVATEPRMVSLGLSKFAIRPQLHARAAAWRGRSDDLPDRDQQAARLATPEVLRVTAALINGWRWS